MIQKSPWCEKAGDKLDGFYSIGQGYPNSMDLRIREFKLGPVRNLPRLIDC